MIFSSLTLIFTIPVDLIQHGQGQQDGIQQVFHGAEWQDVGARQGHDQVRPQERRQDGERIPGEN